MEFNAYSKKNLNFHVEIEGAAYQNLEFKLRMVIDGIEYGFKGKMLTKNKIQFLIPPLSDILSYQAEFGTIHFDVINAGKFFRNPWNSKFSIVWERKERVKPKTNKGYISSLKELFDV